MTDTSRQEGQIAVSEGGAEPLGTTRVANEVVAWIAALAALEVDGVHAMYQPGGPQFGRILRRPAAHEGVRVEFKEGRPLKLDLFIVIDSAINVPAMGAEVQRHVSETIHKMLGLDIAEINVFVNEVAFR